MAKIQWTRPFEIRLDGKLVRTICVGDWRILKPREGVRE